MSEDESFILEVSRNLCIAASFLLNWRWFAINEMYTCKFAEQLNKNITKNRPDQDLVTGRLCLLYVECIQAPRRGFRELITNLNNMEFLGLFPVTS